GRAGDHRPQPRLPRAGSPARGAPRARHGLARHGHPRELAAGRELRGDPRVAPGHEDRLPGRGGLPPGLDRPRRGRRPGAGVRAEQRLRALPAQPARRASTDLSRSSGTTTSTALNATPTIANQTMPTIGSPTLAP